MKALLVLVTLLALGASVPVAVADPGALDRTFGRGGRVLAGPAAGFSGASATDAVILTRGELGIVGGGSLQFVGPRGAVRPAEVPRGAQVLSVLPDGRYYTSSSFLPGYVGGVFQPSVQLLSRRLRTGRLDLSFGVGGRQRLVGGFVAAGRDGRLTVTKGFTATLDLRDDAGRTTAEVAQEEAGGAVRATRYETRGRLVVAAKSYLGPGTVRRFLVGGMADPSFTPQVLDFNPNQLLLSAKGTRILLTDGAYDPHPPLLLDGDGRAMALAPAVVRELARTRALTFDGQDRLVVADDARLLRISADGQHVVLLRDLGPAVHFGGRLGYGAVDARGRLVLGGYELVEAGIDPADCGDCREDTADTRGVLLRFEGGDRRIAVVSTKLASTVAVRCLAAARRRCSGTLDVRGADGRRSRRQLSLAAGATRRFAVPRRVRRGARSVAVEARVVDGTGELATATRTLRR